MKLLFIVLISNFILFSKTWYIDYCEQANQCSDGFLSTLNCAPPKENHRKFGKQLFYENFENVQLKTSPNYPGPQFVNNAYTEQFPQGWDNISNTQPGGCEEYKQFSIMNAKWWYQGGDSGKDSQKRDEFVPGQCKNVVIADNDNYNCVTDGRKMDVSFITPEIDIQGIAADTLSVIFNQSWRPYDTAIGIVSISYDGRDFQPIFSIHSEESNQDHKPDSTNETIVVSAQNPEGASKARVKFHHEDPNNGWWWGIARIGLFDFPCKNGYFSDGTDVCTTTEITDHDPNCGYVSTECNSLGQKIKICSEDDIIVKQNIKSVYVPPGKKLIVFNDKNQSASFNKSVNCLSSVDYKSKANLMQQGITVTQNKQFLKKNAQHQKETHHVKIVDQ